MENIIYLLAIVAAVWVIYDVLTNQKKMSGGSKVIWIIFALLFSIITAIIYYFTKKR
jgi:prolipoprotein diacylglyceryltransferase